MDLPLYHLSETWWQEVYKKVKSAVVFIDNTMCECLHWHGGATKLFSAGAVACKEFSSFESGSSSQHKGVFLTSGPIIDTKREVVRDIITASKFQHCVVITAAGPTVQMFAEKRKTGHDMSAFQQLEHDLFKWMGGNKEFVVELLSFPLFLAPITSNVFIMPIFNHLFPPFFDKEREMFNDWSPRENKQKIEMNSLPFESRVDAFHLMSCLQSLLSLLNLNDDIYCMGQLSEIIANCLETHPQTLSRRKKSSERASLILIDRNLDAAAAATYSSDCLFDRIKASLPNLPEHGCDVAIDMTPISGLKANKLRSKSGKSLLVSSGIPPGCLSHPESSVPVIDWIINQKQYDILINLQKILLNKSNLRITAQSFEKQILSTFSGKHDLIHEHSSVLQQSLAVITALTSHDVDMVIGIEKLLLMAIAAGGTTEALTQLSTAIRTREGRGLTIEQLLVVLVHLYSVIGPDVENSPDAEMLVQAELCKAINEDRQKMDALMNNNSVLLDLGVDEAMGVNDVEVLVRSIFVALRRISKSRHNLVRYRSLMKKESSVFPAEYVPLIQQLFNDLLNPQVHEIPQDLISISSSNKSGLSSLLMRPGRHPMDNKVILVFIVGGITGHEIRLMNELFKSTGKHLIIGSNRFLSPTDILRSLFTDHSDYRTCINDQNKRENSF